MKICSGCKEAKAEDQFYRKDLGLQDQCKACKKEYNKRHYKRNKSSYLVRAKVSNTQRRREYREKMDALKCQPCMDCKVQYPPYVMDFDHLTGKKLSVARAVCNQWPWEKILSEVAKCDLVCANCHRKRTHQRLLAGDVIR